MTGSEATSTHARFSKNFFGTLWRTSFVGWTPSIAKCWRDFLRRTSEWVDDNVRHRTPSCCSVLNWPVYSITPNALAVPGSSFASVLSVGVSRLYLFVLVGRFSPPSAVFFVLRNYTNRVGRSGGWDSGCLQPIFRKA